MSALPVLNPSPAPGSAVLSQCGRYRYRLSRILNAGSKVVLFVGLNPSTADATLDDPTIRRMKGFAAMQGAGLLLVGNLFAYRATEPRELLKLDYLKVIGPENDAHLADMAERADIVIAAWGSFSSRWPRASHVKGLLIEAHGGPVMCLGRTQEGWPKHPLYLKTDTRTEVY